MRKKSPLYFKLYYDHIHLRKYNKRKLRKTLRVHKANREQNPIIQQRKRGKDKLQNMFDTIPQILEFLEAFPEIEF
jgi:hypothetical protein